MSRNVVGGAGGLLGDPKSGESLPAPPVLLGLLALYAVAQVFDGLAIGNSAGFAGAIVRGPWIAARTIPFLLLLTLRRHDDQTLALAAGLAFGQLFSSSYIDAPTRATLGTSGGVASFAAVISCLACLAIVLFLWLRRQEVLESAASFALRAAVAAGVFVALSLGPVATILATGAIMAPLGLRWR